MPDLFALVALTFPSRTVVLDVILLLAAPLAGRFSVTLLLKLPALPTGLRRALLMVCHFAALRFSTFPVSPSHKVDLLFGVGFAGDCFSVLPAHFGGSQVFYHPVEVRDGSGPQQSFPARPIACSDD